MSVRTPAQLLGAVQNFLHTHFQDHVGVGTHPHTSRCDVAQQRIELYSVLSLGNWIDPDEHAVGAEKLLAHFICHFVRIDRGLRLDAERGQRFENAVESIVMCGCLASRLAIPTPEQHQFAGFTCGHVESFAFFFMQAVYWSLHTLQFVSRQRISTAPDTSRRTSTTLTVKFRAKPCAGEQRGQSEQKQPDRIRRCCALDAKPRSAHGEGRHGNRLEDRPLPIFRPTAQAAPDRHQYARESGYSTENAIQKPDTGVSGDTAGGHRCDFRTSECVKAVENEKYADAGLDVYGVRPAENGNADRHADHSASQERPELAPLQRVLQLPDRVTLHDQAERNDQRRGL